MRKFPNFEEMVLPTTMHAEFVKLLVGRGVSEHDVLQGTGIEPGHLGSSEARLSLLQAAILADNALKLTGDPALGLEFGRHIHINGIGVVGLAVMSSRNLSEANIRMLRYYRLMAINVRLELEVHDGLMELSIHDSVPLGQLRPFSHEATVACLHALSQFVVGKPLPYREIRFSYPDPGYADRYHEVFGCDVIFDAPLTCLVMDAEALDWELPYASVATAKFADQQCVALLAAHQGDDVVQQVLHMLQARVDDAPPLTTLAKELQTSERSLRRALSELGTSYRALLAEARRNRAVEMLTGTRKTLEQIAESLGFANARSFRRAFTRWTGKSPTAVRRGA